MEKQEYQAIIKETVYDAKCFANWEAEEQKFRQIHQKTSQKELKH